MLLGLRGGFSCTSFGYGWVERLFKISKTLKKFFGLGNKKNQSISLLDDRLNLIRIGLGIKFFIKNCSRNILNNSLFTGETCDLRSAIFLLVILPSI